MTRQALHIPTGEENQSLLVAGKTIKMKPVQIYSRPYMVPAGITRTKDNSWLVLVKRDKAILVQEYFADGVYSGLAASALSHAIARLIEVLEEYEASKQ